VILACPTNSHVPAPDGRLRKNPIEQVEKKRSDFYNNRDCAGGPLLITSRNRFARRKRQIAILKKSGVEFYTSSFCKVRALIVGQNQLSWPKNLPNTGETQLVPTGEIDEKIAASVTTNHLLWPTQRWKTVALLPISQPNSQFLAANAARALKGAGGSTGRDGPKSARPKSSHGILWVIHPLLHSCCFEKMRRAARGRAVDPILKAHVREC
jgi:hypothetical protein